MRKKLFPILTAWAFSFLAALCCSTPVSAAAAADKEPDPAVTAAYAASGEQSKEVTSNGITFRVTYPSNITCNTNTSFRFETVGPDGNPLGDAQYDVKYRIHSLMVHDGSEYVSVYDVSKGENSKYSKEDHFDFTFYASGKYYIRFNVMYKNSSGQYIYLDTGGFDRGIVLNINDPGYPSVEEITARVAGECQAQCSTDYDKALWLNDWVVDNCVYDSDLQYCSAEGVLARGTGTCEAYHRAYVMLLNKVGIATGRITGNGHVWTAAKLDGAWYHIDTTWNDTEGYTDPNVDLKHLYFGLNDEIISNAHSDHKPVKGYEANSLDQNYFIKTGKIAKWADPQIEAVRKHIAARETEFTIEINNVYYADVLYGLVAHVLTNTSWSEKDLNIKLQAKYTPTVNKQNGIISCSVQYGNFQFQSISLQADSVKIGANAQLNYALNRAATVTVQVFDQNNRCLKTLVSKGNVGTGSQSVQWDLKNSSGGYVANGSYYFAITAADAQGNTITERKNFQVTGNVSGAVTVYNGIDYAPVYDYNYYVNRYADIKQAYGTDTAKALQHFVNYGMKEGRQGSANFDVHSYRNAYADLRRAFGTDLKSYYMHYIQSGKKEGRIATGCNTLRGAITTYNGVDYSLVYDYNFYVNKYADIKRAFGGDDARVLQHFVTSGMKEGRQGCADFDVNSYRNAYADLRSAYGSDLKSYYLHYIRNGKKEGRVATGCNTLRGAVTKYNGVDYSAVYDYEYYTGKYPDIKAAFKTDDVAVLKHFVNYGMKEGRQGSKDFDVQSYQNQYVDLRKAYGNHLKSYYEHFVKYGKKEGRKGTGCATVQGATTVYNGVDYKLVYDYYYYTSKNADIKRAYGNNDQAALAHFVNYGMKEGRIASSNFNVSIYRSKYQDLNQAYGNNLKKYFEHYLNYGAKEGRTAK